MWPGPSEQQKRRLAEQIVEHVVTTLTVRRRVCIGLHRGSEAERLAGKGDRPEIESLMVKLCKKPGYGPSDLDPSAMAYRQAAIIARNRSAQPKVAPACYGAGGWSDAGLRRPGQDVAPLTFCVSFASAAPRGRPRTACPVKPRSTSLRRPGALLPPLRADASNPLPGWRHSTTC